MRYIAPGKVVLWGEYAVLNGAPAAVMAVDRYATVDLEHASTWRFSCRGFLTPGIYRTHAEFCHAPAAALAETVAQFWGAQQFEAPFALTSDSTAFYRTDGRKLGIGSSAAVSTATYLAMAEMANKPATMQDAIAVHRQFQGGSGSGLDVAASWQGGVIRYQHDAADAWALPADFHWQVMWTGTSATTTGSLSDFGKWRANNDTTALDDLCEAAESLFKTPTTANLAEYTGVLEALDAAAKLNIFTPEHRRLATIATAHGLVYKPCGAGGGDIGLACGADPDDLRAFADAAAAERLVPLDLEIAPHGVKAG